MYYGFCPLVSRPELSNIPELTVVHQTIRLKTNKTDFRPQSGCLSN